MNYARGSYNKSKNTAPKRLILNPIKKVAKTKKEEIDTNESKF